MDIIIQSLGFKASDALEDFIKEKLNNLKSDRIIRANVVLYKGAAGSPESDYCEIRLEVPGNDHFVKKHSQHFETSASECVEILTQMLKQARDKHVDARQADAIRIQDQLMEGGEDDVELEDVVK
ncbi:MAG: HPF/RaiA family ribosome-associated protein [Chitinophagaceae bacterium]